MKVLLGMSGGIDSSVAAMLLLEQGFEVIGATLRLWSEHDRFDNTSNPEYINEAKLLADKLGIKHYVIDAKHEFYHKVVAYFKNEYISGRTPNPCAKCNVVLKWDLLNKLAKVQGCEYIATGHYVNKIQDGSFYYVSKGIDPDKEQSFFLWGLSQEILAKAKFPLGNLTKMQVKQIASNNGFTRLEQKKESTGACFLTNQNYHGLIEREFEGTGMLPGTGSFIDCNGNILGQHKGYPFYTVGQRRGLGLVPKEPYYVTVINTQLNTVQLGLRNDLYKHSMVVKNYNVINKSNFENKVITRIRYRKQSAQSQVTFIDDKTLRVDFEEPEWSIAPGQTAAFYIGDKLLGGGYIEC